MTEEPLDELHRQADTIIATFDAKMAAIEDVLGRERAIVLKSVEPDTLKADKLGRLEKVADDFRREVISETRAAIDSLKSGAQPAKAAISEVAIKPRGDALWDGLAFD